MRLTLWFAFFCAIASRASAADPEAGFLGESVYAAIADCPRVKKIAAGGVQSAATVPTTLTAKGYTSFEGSCRFTNIDERYKGRIWTVSLVCGDGRSDSTARVNAGRAETSRTEILRTEVWRRQADGSLTVTVNKTSTTFVACGADRPAAGQRK